MTPHNQEIILDLVESATFLTMLPTVVRYKAKP